MKKIDFGQSIQLVANLGVIAGIVFLAVELQQNNELLSAQARTERAAVRISYVDALSSNPMLLSAIVKDRHLEPLTREEEVLLEEWYTGTLARWQYVYGEYQEELVDEADVPVGDWSAYYAENPAFAKTWRQTGLSSFRPDFVQFMEENVVNHGSEQ